MQISLDQSYSGHSIRRYEPGRIMLGDRQVIETSLVITAEQLITNWRPQTFDDLKAGDFDLFRELKPEIALLGTGKRMRLVGREIRAFFADLGLGLEVMDTAAACRTFDVLASEDRSVAAALLMI
jgi:uncharacterized protein